MRSRGRNASPRVDVHERSRGVESRATLEGEKTAVLKDLDASHRRADKAEALLEKVKSAFNV